MTTKTIAKAISRRGQPAIIKEKGMPRYVILDWETYQGWEELREDLEDNVRFDRALRASQGKKRYSLQEIKKKYRLS